MTVLYANGDSLTVGTEILPPRDEVIALDPVMKKQLLDLSWPGLLGNMMDVDLVVNDGVAGCSNESIMRRTMRWLETEYLNPGKSTDDLFVIIAWSEPGRQEFVMDGSPNAILPNRPAFYMYSEETRLFWNKYRVYAQEPAPLWELFLQQVVLMQAYLHMHDVKYGMVCTLHGFSEWFQEEGPWRYETNHDRMNSTMGSLTNDPAWPLIDQNTFLLYPCMMDVIYDSGVTIHDLPPRGHVFGKDQPVWAKYVFDLLHHRGLI